MSDDPQKNGGRSLKLNIKIDDDTAQGVYANLAMVVHGESEFVLDFMFLQPGRKEAKVSSRVILSPIQAKRLLSALGDNVNRYERRFGTIPLPGGATDSKDASKNLAHQGEGCLACQHFNAQWRGLPEALFQWMMSFESVAPPGRGGSSTVYQATIEGRDQEVALKILRPELLEQPTQVERFRREALHVANLRHPNTVRLLDYGQLSNGLVFAAIELLKGEPLSSRLARVGRLPFTQALHIIVQVLYSLSEAHQQNIIHRDLKPANIFLCEEPVRASVRVLDFGMALALDTLQVRLTTQGDIPGTPQYMAPEQASDQPLAKATDIYAVGLIFYEMLTGQHPFRGMRDMDVLFRKRNRSMHYNLDALPQGDAQLIEEVLAKSLEPDMYTRYPDAEAMLKALEARIAIPPPVSIDEFYSVTAVQARHRKAVLARLLERAEEALGTEDWIEARDSYQSALGVINTLATVDHSDGEEIEGKRGKALLNLSKALVALDALGVAEDALREAVQVLPYSSIEGLEARIMLADIITEQGLHERGAAFYDAALAHLTEQTPTSLHDRVYLGLATVAFHNADHHDSIAFIEELRDPNPRLKFQATVLKLRALCGLGRGPDAWAFVAQVEEEQDESMRIELLLAVSELAESQGLLDRAAQYLEKVFGLQKGLRNDYAGRYTTAQRLAELEAKRGRIESAYIYAGQSVAIARTMNDRWREIAARLAFGELLASEHDYLRAVEEIRVARRIQKDMNDREGLARSHYLLGDVCCQAGDMKAARKYFKEAMRYENEQATEFMVMAATRVAEVTEGMGKLDRAAEYYTYAIQVAGDIGIVQVGHRPRLGMARLQIALGEYLMAESFLQQVLGSARFDGLTREIVNAGLYLNWLYTFWGQGATIPPQIDEALTSVRGQAPNDLSPLIHQWRHEATVLLQHVTDQRPRTVLTQGLRSMLTDVLGEPVN